MKKKGMLRGKKNYSKQLIIGLFILGLVVFLFAVNEDIVREFIQKQKIISINNFEKGFLVGYQRDIINWLFSFGDDSELKGRLGSGGIYGAGDSEDEPMIFGINYMSLTLNYASHIPAGEVHLQMIEDAGFEYLRVHYSWDSIEPTEGNYDWSNLDAFYNSLGKFDLKAYPILWITPEWASSAPSGTSDADKIWYAPSDINKWEEFVERSVQRYGHNGYFWVNHIDSEFHPGGSKYKPVEYWEIWNEQNYPMFFRSDYADYINLLETASSRIREIDPQAEILHGAIAGCLDFHNAEIEALDFLNNYDSSFDIFNPHHYYAHPCGGSGQDLTFEEVVELNKGYVQDTNSNKDIWFTELGVADYVGPDEFETAREVVKYNVFGIENGLGAIFWALFRYAGANSFCETLEGHADWAECITLIYEDNTKKPGYYSYQTLTGKIKGYSSFEKLQEGQYRFDFNDKGSVYVVWSDTGVQDLNSEIVGNLKVTSMFGDVSFEDESNIMVGYDPIYLEEVNSYCGDGVCDVGEDVENCEEDCGENIKVCDELEAYNDNQIDSRDIFQTCIDEASPGDIIDIPVGKYYLKWAIVLDKAITLRTQGKTVDMKKCSYEENHDCAEIIALEDFSSGGGFIYVPEQVTNLTFHHIVLNGNKDERTRKEVCDSGGGMQLVGCKDCIFKGNVFKNAVCQGTLTFQRGTNVTIDDNSFVYNGFHETDDWSDGLTFIEGNDSTITNNLFIDNTDVDFVVGGCQNCQISNNNITHSNNFLGSSFAAFIVYHWPSHPDWPYYVDSSGDFTGTTISNNNINCGELKRCGYGLLIGGDVWYGDDINIFGGNVSNNIIKNAQQGLSIDDAHDFIVKNNLVVDSGGGTITKLGAISTSRYNVGLRSYNIDAENPPLTFYTNQNWRVEDYPNWWDRPLSDFCEDGYCDRDLGETSENCEEDCGGCTPSPEICDGLDNDCDGSVDEGGDSLCVSDVGCTDNVCNGLNGCSFTENHNNCANELFCDGDEICSINDGGCINQNVPDCSDVYSCTDDNCDESSNICVNIENDANCDNNNYCDINLFTGTGCGNLNNCIDSDNDGYLDYDSVLCPNGKDLAPYTNASYFMDNPGAVNLYSPIKDYFNISEINKTNIMKHNNFFIEYNESKIVFNEIISLVKINETGGFERLNLTKFIRIEDELVFLNSSYFPEFNKSANITILGINYTNPNIHKDGIECADCNIINYTKGSFLKFGVTGFISYDVQGGTYCGDSICNNGETCSSCSGDCGDCDEDDNGGPTTPPVIINCTERWSCTGWSNCSNGNKTRTCNDLNNCNIADRTPKLETKCGVEEEPGEIMEEEPNKVIYPQVIFYLFIGLLVIGIIIVLFILIFKGKGIVEKQ